MAETRTVELAFDEHGDAHDAAVPLVIIHGLFGSRRNWRGIAKNLASDRRVLGVDLRNHGESPWVSNMSYPEMARDIVALLDRLDVEHADLLGHSMGGKVAMRTALASPHRVRRLAVLDIAPIAYLHHGEEFSGIIDALCELPLAEFASRGDVDAALAATIASPGLRAFLLQNLVREDGRFRWRLNLEVLREELATVGGEIGLESANFTQPVKVIHGSNSSYIKPECFDEHFEQFPLAERVSLDAGHWLHAERPEELLAALKDFFDA